jgi:hypothetical protein
VLNRDQERVLEMGGGSCGAGAGRDGKLSEAKECCVGARLVGVCVCGEKEKDNGVTDGFELRNGDCKRN